MLTWIADGISSTVAVVVNRKGWANCKQGFEVRSFIVMVLCSGSHRGEDGRYTGNSLLFLGCCLWYFKQTVSTQVFPLMLRLPVFCLFHEQTPLEKAQTPFTASSKTLHMVSSPPLTPFYWLSSSILVWILSDFCFIRLCFLFFFYLDSFYLARFTENL